MAFSTRSFTITPQSPFSLDHDAREFVVIGERDPVMARLQGISG